MSPLNISRKYIKGKCDLKCAYNFDYKDSTAIATNKGKMITIKQDDKLPCVLYNKKKYYVLNSCIFSPSIHLYNDKYADAEFMIVHAPTQGGPFLSVYIPIMISTSQPTSASSLITDVIKNVSLSANSNGQKVNIGDFNLQKIVPNKPFVNYVYPGMENIVFTLIDSIPITSPTIDTLKEMISQVTLDREVESLYYNSSGPNSTSNVSEGIYISCNPTGSSTETTDVTYAKNDNQAVNLLENPNFIMFLQILAASILFIFVCFVFNYFYNLIDGSKIMTSNNKVPNKS
jgi:hypothetical protein